MRNRNHRIFQLQYNGERIVTNGQTVTVSTIAGSAAKRPTLEPLHWLSSQIYLAAIVRAVVLLSPWKYCYFVQALPLV